MLKITNLEFFCLTTSHMKTICSLILVIGHLYALGQSAHINEGPTFVCPGSEVIYTYSDTYGCGVVRLTIFEGEIFDPIDEVWVSAIEFNEGFYPYLSNNYPFRVRWLNRPLGTVGKVKVRVCLCDGDFPTICSNGERNVTIGPSSGSPVISGSGTILNCIDQTQAYTPINFPDGWVFNNWNLSSGITKVGSGNLPITVKAISTSSQGMQSLTGNFSFTVGGVTCGTQSVVKNIWLGRPAVSSQSVDGQSYYPGMGLCPGNHWVNVTWNGAISGTNWTVSPYVPNFTNNNECSFTLPNNSSAVAITVNAYNICGPSSNTSFYITKRTYGCGSLNAMVFPNPASTDLFVSTSTKNGSNEAIEIIADEIRLLDSKGNEVRKVSPGQSTSYFSLESLLPGEYFVDIKFGNSKSISRILIKK